jgi:outer membrane protein OmpA-like peptidoglycan-associated protein
LKSSEEKVSIVGHTDDVGEETDNVRLGLQRAESIQRILLEKGISKDRISIDSKGERQPATSNSTEEGRYRNRRTVLRIIK